MTMSNNPYDDMRTGPSAPTIAKVQYRWKLPHRQYKVGDPFPESFGSGVRDTMIRAGRVEVVTSSVAPINDEKQSLKSQGFAFDKYGHGVMLCFYADGDAWFCGRSKQWMKQPLVQDEFGDEAEAIAAAKTIKRPKIRRKDVA